MQTKKILEKIKNARKAQGLTQEELAQQLDIAQNSYSKYETGYSEMSLNLFLDIVEILDINLATLFDIKSYIQKEDILRVIQQLQILEKKL